MKSKGTRGMVAVWVAVALVASVAIFIERAYGATSFLPGLQALVINRFGSFKIVMTPLLGESEVGFNIVLDEPVNCKCTVNMNSKNDHGIGQLAITMNNFGTSTSPSVRLSYHAVDHDGAERSGHFCPTTAVDGEPGFFLIGATCAGGLAGPTVNQIPGSFNSKVGGGHHLVQCCDDNGIFIATSPTAANPTRLSVDNHVAAQNVRLLCEFIR